MGVETFPCAQCCSPPGCCETSPDEIVAEFTSRCAALNGLVVTLSKIADNSWRGTASTSCGVGTFNLFCLSGTWFGDISLNNGFLDSFGGVGFCSPFDVTITFNVQSEIDCCVGDSDQTVGHFTL